MTEADLDVVLEIERAAYPFPWTPGNFRDCMRSGYLCLTAWIEAARVGYLIAAPIVDEMHVLNCCVAPAWQRRGLGVAMMRHLMGRLGEVGATRLLLEVRESNVAARGLYHRLGFVEVGRRRGYYPAADGREDARVLVWEEKRNKTHQ